MGSHRACFGVEHEARDRGDPGALRLMRGCHQAGGVAVSEGCGREVPAAEPLCGGLGAAAPGLTSCKCGWNRSETPLFSTPWFPRKSAPHCSPVRLPFSGGVTVRRRRVARVLEERYGKTTVLSQQIPHVEGGSTEPLRSLTVRWPPARRWTGHATVRRQVGLAEPCAQSSP